MNLQIAVKRRGRFFRHASPPMHETVLQLVCGEEHFDGPINCTLACTAFSATIINLGPIHLVIVQTWTGQLPYLWHQPAPGVRGGTVPHEEGVTFANSEITLAGTLTLPDNAASHPAVVLLLGSGPLNRDEEIPGVRSFKPFAIIAEHFSRQGIATLRYDSRGVGDSAGTPYEYTLSEVAEDALAAVRFLKNRGDIDPVRIGLCGHSQGGIVAPMCAARSPDIAFIICMSGIGTTGAENLLSQVRSIAEIDGESDRQVEERLRSLRRIMKLIRGRAGRSDLEPEVAEMVRKEKSAESLARVKQRSTTHRKGEETTDSGSDEAVAAEINCHLDLFGSTWFRSFLDHDAQPFLDKVTCPVLLIFGELDRQVRPEENIESMTNALKRGGNTEVLVRVFPRANHLFQRAGTGSPSEYGELGDEFVPGFLELMSGWILEKVGTP